MQLGATLPVADIGTGPAIVRDYLQAVEGLGYSHLLVGDHVLGADRAGGVQRSWGGASSPRRSAFDMRPTTNEPETMQASIVPGTGPSLCARLTVPDVEDDAVESFRV
jgi:hypothetical protein